MKIKDIEAYEEWKSKQTDGYGQAVFRYAEKWAELMEEELDNGHEVKNVAGKLSHEADTEGITGFMYGAAVSVLTHCWEYGEELRKWHNGEYGYDGEGVVNPAIMTVGVNK